MKVDITVVRIPDVVVFECPHCENEIEIKYLDFCCGIGEPCDWVYSKFDCPECEKQIEIDYVDWD